jgi:hypothetical protein
MEYEIEDTVRIVRGNGVDLAIYKPTPLSATPNPLCNLSLVLHTTASFLTLYFFVACGGT